jgi:hypothetical protein
MVSLIDYDLVREHPRRFLLAAGHVDAKAAYGRILEAENGYAIIERVGPGRG